MEYEYRKAGVEHNGSRIGALRLAERNTNTKEGSIWCAGHRRPSQSAVSSVAEQGTHVGQVVDVKT